MRNIVEEFMINRRPGNEKRIMKIGLTDYRRLPEDKARRDDIKNIPGFRKSGYGAVYNKGMKA
jgi:hypothetical protein